MNATIERLLQELTDEICCHERSAGCGSTLVLIPYDSTLPIAVYQNGKPLDLATVDDENLNTSALIVVDSALNERDADRILRLSKV